MNHEVTFEFQQEDGSYLTVPWESMTDDERACLYNLFGWNDR